LLTLDSCRALALQNNRQLTVAKVRQDMAENTRRSARTKYLPRLSAVGTYEHTTRPVSLLNDHQKSTLPQIGTAVGTSLQQSMAGAMTQLPSTVMQALGLMGLTPEVIGQMTGQGIGQLTTALNSAGQEVVDALNTNTRNIWAGSIMLTQPLFMGGSIVAMNRMADINEQLARNTADAKRQAVLYSTDKAYWQVVSLRHKQKLAEAYLEVVKKLDSDVHKMIDEGVATRSDGLTVDVKVNEAEMALTRVNDGLVLSRMLLCQTIGLPVREQVKLADEESADVAAATSAAAAVAHGDLDLALGNRPELKLLQNTVDLSLQSTNLLKAGNLPQVALTGGYLVSNPNVLNGFEKKFGGMWNIGVMVRVPIWNWGDNMYKVRASKGATAIARLELLEARELVELELSQVNYKADEAQKRLTLAQSSVKRADENLRTANLGFQEGVITPATVMEAQTAWLQAQSQQIDAEIDVRLSQVELQKTLGTLAIE
jgi:outer membrane protein TolC